MCKQDCCKESKEDCVTQLLLLSLAHWIIQLIIQLIKYYYTILARWILLEINCLQRVVLDFVVVFVFNSLELWRRDMKHLKLPLPKKIFLIATNLNTRLLQLLLDFISILTWYKSVNIETLVEIEICLLIYNLETVRWQNCQTVCITILLTHPHKLEQVV